MINTNEFGVLLKEGIASVAGRQRIRKNAVEQALADLTGYSTATIVHWQRGNLPTERDSVELALNYCAQNGRVGRDWAAALLRSADYTADQSWSLLSPLFEPHIFISYQINIPQDRQLASQLAQKLSGRSNVFFDQEEWMTVAHSDRVRDQLQQADFFIVLLSADSVSSDTIHRQVKQAYIQSQSRLFPIILPICIGEYADFPISLAPYIDLSNTITWCDKTDTERIVKQIGQVLQNGRSSNSNRATPHATPAQPNAPSPTHTLPLELPSSPITHDSRFYIERPSDQIALSAIRRSKVTLTIKGARQIGKTSLLSRVIDAARTSKKHVAHLDFELLQPFTVKPDLFYAAFCRTISDKLNLPDYTEKVWEQDRSNPDRTEKYMSLILRQLNMPLLLAIDNAEAIFGAPFQTDFFGMLRYWHNKRATSMQWKNLDLALVTSTEPYFFIENLNQSPFNVGEIIELHPFTLEQTAELNALHNTPLTSSQTETLHQFLNGHPYLTRRLLYAVASNQMTFDTVINTAIAPNGQFYDALRILLQIIEIRNDDILTLLQSLVKNGSVSRLKVDNQTYFKLNGLGIVRLAGSKILFTNQLYARFFGEWFE